MDKIEFEKCGELGVELQQDGSGSYFEIEGIRAQLPPHLSGKSLSSSELITIFVSTAGSVAVGLLTNFLYDLLLADRVRNLRINGKQVEADKSQISEALKNDETERGD